MKLSSVDISSHILACYVDDNNNHNDEEYEIFYVVDVKARNIILSENGFQYNFSYFDRKDRYKKNSSCRELVVCTSLNIYRIEIEKIFIGCYRKKIAQEISNIFKKNNIDECDEFEKTILIKICEYGFLINIRGSIGRLNIARELIKNGANVNSKDIYGRTPLYYCFGAQSNKHNVAKLLIENKADINIIYSRGLCLGPLLLQATLGDDIKMIKLLTKYGANKYSKYNGASSISMSYMSNKSTNKFVLDLCREDFYLFIFCSKKICYLPINVLQKIWKFLIT
jgi:hypothetical protein